MAYLKILIDILCLTVFRVKVSPLSQISSMYMTVGHLSMCMGIGFSSHLGPAGLCSLVTWDGLVGSGPCPAAVSAQGLLLPALLAWAASSLSERTT